MIRSTKHSIKFLNDGKKNHYHSFLNEYRRVSSVIGDSIWNDGYESFSINDDILDFPKYVDYNKFKVETWLSARCLSSIVTQISSMIRGAVDKRKRYLFISNKLKTNNESSEHLDNKLDAMTLIKPEFSKINLELSSKNVDIRKGKHFDYFVSLKSIGDDKICIPIKKTRLDIKWEKRGKLLGGFLFSEDKIEFRYDVVPEENNSSITIGIEQGMNDILTISDGRTTPKTDTHGNTLHSILEKMSKKKKGSRAFQRAQEQRKNFINWSINQLNFRNVQEVRFEKIYNIGYKKRKSRKLSHWTNTLIRDKVKRVCEEMKVSFIEQSSSYRSQRCSHCGLVRKANRKGKSYKCNNCNLEMDSDLNAAKNHLCDLPDVHWKFRGSKHNLGKGFFWKPNGLFDWNGQELRVPVS